MTTGHEDSSELSSPIVAGADGELSNMTQLRLLALTGRQRWHARAPQGM